MRPRRDNELAAGRSLWHGEGMRTDELRQLLRGSAFRPFTVYVGEQGFHVPHPEFAALTPRGQTLIVLHKDDEAFDILDVALIGRAEVQQRKAKSS